MAGKIDQKAYLQKYLSGSSGSKKEKKKKKRIAKGQGFKIIDDDLDLSKLQPLDGDELDILDQGEDAPQIAGIIDERPEDVRKAEQFNMSSKWRVINRDDGFSSKLQIEEIKRNKKELQKENEIVFGKMYSDSEDDKNDSDLSPPRKHTKGLSKQEKHLQSNKSDSDVSPPRKNDSSKTTTTSKTKERVRKPSRWGNAESNHETKSDSDTSPNRQKHRRDQYLRKDSPKRRKKDSDESPPRNKHRDSPERSKRKENKHSYDSDISPPRKLRKDLPKSLHYSAQSLSKEKYSPNKSKASKQRIENSSKRRSPSSDLSPPRKSKRKSISPQTSKKGSKKRKNSSDSDLSPPRSRKNKEDRRYNRNSDSPPPTNKKMARTLEGKMAGLQNAIQLRQENDAFRNREEEAFSKMTDDVSGRNAKAISRKSKRDTSEDRQKQREKAEKQKEIDEKYKQWNKGIKQVEAQEARYQDFMHEASKPLARHKGDADLETRLKDVEREGDPMLKYIREKKRERGELEPERPMYKGNFPPNRFNIRPGYRWDGVDRSNGYEKKYFENQSKRKAQEEEAYKWSTEDL